MAVGGLKEVEKHLNNLIKAMGKASQEGLNRGAIVLHKKAIDMSPFVTGDLIASSYIVSKDGMSVGDSSSFSSGRGTTSGAGEDGGFLNAKEAPQHHGMESDHIQSVSVATAKAKEKRGACTIVGFSAYYASEVHENPNTGRSLRGSRVGMWKFLQNAAYGNRQEIAAAVHKDMKQNFGFGSLRAMMGK